MVLRSKKRVLPREAQRGGIDSVKAGLGGKAPSAVGGLPGGKAPGTGAGTGAGTERGVRVLMQAQRHYLNMATFRKERDRNKRYTYNDQWGDTICVDGRMMTEEEYIRRQGNVPLKNNLIRKLVRTIVGVYREQSKEPICISRDREEQKLGETMSTLLQYNMQLNHAQELNVRSLEEFLISGLAVQRKWYGRMRGREDVWTTMVPVNNFFVDTRMHDCRCWDCELIGEIHDVSFPALVSQFAKCPEDYARLAEIYQHSRDAEYLGMTYREFGCEKDWDKSFLVPEDAGSCRVIEVWRKETRGRYWCHDWNTGDVFKADPEDLDVLVNDVNAKRLVEGAQLGMPADEIPLIEFEYMVDAYWYCYYLTPTGEILWEGETPYQHQEHPYVMKCYPFIDGEIHSPVSDVVDQQRYVNRLITLQDWVIRASAKGVLLIPEDSIPAGMSPTDFAEEWSRHDGVIIYRPSKSHEVPKQVSANSTQIGVTELLQMQLRLVEDISGVNGALQGKPGYSGMSAALYHQQTQNATTSLRDIMDTFGDFVREGAMKDVKIIQQYYDAKKIWNIAGEKQVEGKIESSLVDPSKIKDAEFDLSIVESQTTPAYRAVMNDLLLEIWRSGGISIEDVLSTGSFPFGDELLQKLQARKEEEAQRAMQAQAAQAAMPSEPGGEAPGTVGGGEEG